MNRRKHLLAFSVMAIFLMIPGAATACEPVIPLMMVVAGPAFVMRSVVALIGAVALKCAAFAFYERSLPTTHAAFFMFVANVVSTCVGVLVGAAIAVPMIFITLPIVYVMTVLPARRLQKVPGIPRWCQASFRYLALIFILCLFASYFFFYGATALTDSNSQLYWLAKLAYLYPALCISIGLTTLWEETVVHLLARKRWGQILFHLPVLKANLVALLLLMGLAAALALPKRLASPGYLLGW